MYQLKVFSSILENELRDANSWLENRICGLCRTITLAWMIWLIFRICHIPSRQAVRTYMRRQRALISSSKASINFFLDEALSIKKPGAQHIVNIIHLKLPPYPSVLAWKLRKYALWSCYCQADTAFRRVKKETLVGSTPRPAIKSTN